MSFPKYKEIFITKKCPQCIESKIHHSFYRYGTKQLNSYQIRLHLSKHKPSLLYDYIQYIYYTYYFLIKFSFQFNIQYSEPIMCIGMKINMKMVSIVFRIHQNYIINMNMMMPRGISNCWSLFNNIIKYISVLISIAIINSKILPHLKLTHQMFNKS